jgi:hypothetical protein
MHFGYAAQIGFIYILLLVSLVTILHSRATLLPKGAPIRTLYF